MYAILKSYQSDALTIALPDPGGSTGLRLETDPPLALKSLDLKCCMTARVGSPRTISTSLSVRIESSKYSSKKQKPIDSISDTTKAITTYSNGLGVTGLGSALFSYRIVMFPPE